MMGNRADSGSSVFDIVKALQSSPKGRLRYDTGWDETPNAVTTLIAAVQEDEVDGPNREILERCYRVHHLKERISLSPTSKSTPNSKHIARSRHSLPGNFPKQKESSPNSPLLNSLVGLSLNTKTFRRNQYSTPINKQELRIEVQDASSKDDTDNDNRSLRKSATLRVAANKGLLTPPSPTRSRKKSADAGSPNLKPSPTLSSSTQTQTRSSVTSDATATPTKDEIRGKIRKLGINDGNLNEEQIEEDLVFESKFSPYDLIEKYVARHTEEQELKKVKDATQARLQRMIENSRNIEALVSEQNEADIRAYKLKETGLKRYLDQLEQTNLIVVQKEQQIRSQQDQKFIQEQKVAAAAAEQSRASLKAQQDAAQQKEILRIQNEHEEQKRKEEAAIQQTERLERIAEQNRLEEEARQAAIKSDEAKKQTQVIPELNGLILKDDVAKYAKTSEFLKTYEEMTANIDGKDPNMKPYYVGAVKCINTPLNALADTNSSVIMEKVEHFSKLLAGEAVSGGGSMTTLFSSKSVPNGDLFVMRTLAFRFVKKSEADVTRGTSTVQPLATVGIFLCKKFPNWATLVQANLYKLCPFLVPFSYPQGDKSVQEYARELGHELSGSEAAIQQTFLERLKGYCTLYALMVVKFHNDGPFDIGDATEFFTIGGAWQVIARTVKLEPQVDVTATVIHTLLEILDDRLYSVYKNQFVKLMRLLIINYLPKIKSITPPTKAGSLSRLQIYLEKKYAVSI